MKERHIDPEMTYGVPREDRLLLQQRRLEPVDTFTRTLHGHTILRLREAIVSGRISPGVWLRTQELAEELGVSRIPVREALHALQAEGLVKFYPHRGAMVRNLSADEITEVFLIRSLLEPTAARLAVEASPPGLAEQLTMLVEQLAAAEADPSRWIDLDKAFLMTLYRASGRRILCELIERQRARIECYVRLYIHAPGNISQARQKHREILAACEARDGVRVEGVVREHLAEVQEIYLHEIARSRSTTPQVEG